MLVTKSKSRRWGLPTGWTSKVCLVAQSRLTVCDAMDCNPPGSSVHGIFQARMLEWAAMPSSRGSSHARIEPRSPALQVDSLPSEPPRTYGEQKLKWGESLLKKPETQMILSGCVLLRTQKSLTAVSVKLMVYW